MSLSLSGTRRGIITPHKTAHIMYTCTKLEAEVLHTVPAALDCGT